MKNNNIVSPIENIISDAFGRYAKYIIQDRALPDVRDGLKPVQRRIIYAMSQLGLWHDAPHKKSARTVGEVIGKYHPHGDSSIYEAMVRLSQEWKNNLCLLDMHGNKGSIDGDGPAAMRYTECRLSAFGQEMTNHIDEKTVDFVDNFDGSEQEPTVLPTLFPNLLINGASGIAAGYATNIPPFNPGEVIDAVISVIDHPQCSVDQILSIMPAPDFPTNGLICDLAGVKEAYLTGHGKITIRAEIQQINSKQLAITSIPFDTNKAEIIRSIDLYKEKVDALHIAEVRDESDAHGVNIIIELRSDANIDFIKNYLYKNTKLQIAYHMNMIAIKNRKPVLLDIITYLRSFIDHAQIIIHKSAQFNLARSLQRKEIVQGLIKAVSLIDQVVSLIRRSSDKQDAITQLQQKFAFSLIQAEAIVNLRLYRLSNTDIVQLQTELRELEDKIFQLQNLVNNLQARYLHLKSYLRAFKKQFDLPRQSRISHEQTKIVVDEMDLVENKFAIFTFTRCGYLKQLSYRIWSASQPKENLTKGNDLILSNIVANARDRSVLFTDRGLAITILNSTIPKGKMKDVGDHVNNLVTLREINKLLYVADLDYRSSVYDRQVICCTNLGKIKCCRLNDFNFKRNSSTSYFKLEPNEKVVSVSPVITGQEKVVLLTQQGFLCLYPVDQIPLVSKTASGVKALKLKENDQIAQAVVLPSDIDQILLVANFGLWRVSLENYSLSNRPSAGKMISNCFKQTDKLEIIRVLPIKNSDTVVVIDDQEKKEYIQVKTINYLSPTTRINKKVTYLDGNIWSDELKDMNKLHD